MRFVGLSSNLLTLYTDHLRTSTSSIVKNVWKLYQFVRNVILRTSVLSHIFQRTYLYGLCIELPVEVQIVLWVNRRPTPLGISINTSVSKVRIFFIGCSFCLLSRCCMGRKSDCWICWVLIRSDAFVNAWREELAVEVWVYLHLHLWAPQYWFRLVVSKYAGLMGFSLLPNLRVS